MKFFILGFVASDVSGTISVPSELEENDLGALDKEEEEEERTSCTNTLEPPEEEEEETGSGASTFTVRTSFRQYIFLF